MNKKTRIISPNLERMPCDLCGNRTAAFMVNIKYNNTSSFTLLTCYDCEQLEPEDMINIALANAKDCVN